MYIKKLLLKGVFMSEVQMKHRIELLSRIQDPFSETCEHLIVLAA